VAGMIYNIHATDNLTTNNINFMILLRIFWKFKKWLWTVPLISTRQTITSLLHSLNIKDHSI